MRLYKDHVDFSLGIYLNDESARKKYAQKMRPETYVADFQKKIAFELMRDDFSFESLYKKHGVPVTVHAMELANSVQKYINSKGKQ